MEYEKFPNVTIRENATVKRLFLCRHGETAANASGVLQGRGIDMNLNEKGIAQAEALSSRLKDEHIDIIFCSNLIRAKETAEIVAKYHKNAKFIQVENLAEISWGSWEGTSSPLLPNLLSSWVDGDCNAKAPDGESPLDVERRSVPEIYKCILDNPGKIHGRLLRIILSSIFYHNLDHMNSFTHHNCCINLVDAVIEESQSNHSDNSLLDLHNVMQNIKAKELDDNVHVEKSKLARHEHHPSVKVGIEHPANLKFVPLRLDYRDHLSDELRAE